MTQQEDNPQSSLFIFLRHGESTGNAENRHQGQADFPLTDLGIKQARQLTAAWEKEGRVFDQAISSPQSRARQTAEILTKAIPTKLTFNPIWMERDNGDLAGMLFDEAMKILPPPDFIPLYQPIANTGESQWELFIRASTALNELMKNPPGQYLVISHGALLNMVIHALVGLTPQPNFQGPNFSFSNTGFTSARFIPENNNWILLEHNNTNHLVI
ncbi:MAG: histidine phosphatase family protein [Chloroflexi bacterium]|nr:histidine phosphatase family protein [Chloroflexota bacterium]